MRKAGAVGVVHGEPTRLNTSVPAASLHVAPPFSPRVLVDPVGDGFLGGWGRNTGQRGKTRRRSMGEGMHRRQQYSGLARYIFLQYARSDARMFPPLASHPLTYQDHILRPPHHTPTPALRITLLPPPTTCTVMITTARGVESGIGSMCPPLPSNSNRHSQDPPHEHPKPTHAIAHPHRGPRSPRVESHRLQRDSISTVHTPFKLHPGRGTHVATRAAHPTFPRPPRLSSANRKSPRPARNVGGAG